jgi:hypothetical protein
MLAPISSDFKTLIEVEGVDLYAMVQGVVVRLRLFDPGGRLLTERSYETSSGPPLVGFKSLGRVYCRADDVAGVAESAAGPACCSASKSTSART